MRKILIVEDDTLLNRTLGYNLASDGYEITAAYNHKDAVFHSNGQFLRTFPDNYSEQSIIR